MERGIPDEGNQETQQEKEIKEVKKVSIRVGGRIDLLRKMLIKLEFFPNRQSQNLLDNIPHKIRECVQMVDLYENWLRGGYNPEYQAQFFEREAEAVLELSLERVMKFETEEQLHELSFENCKRLIKEAKQALKLYEDLQKAAEAKLKEYNQRQRLFQPRPQQVPNEPQREEQVMESDFDFIDSSEEKILSEKAIEVECEKIRKNSSSKTKTEEKSEDLRQSNQSALRDNSSPLKLLLNEQETQRIAALKQDAFWTFYAGVDRVMRFLCQKLLSPPITENPLLNSFQRAELLLYTLKKYFIISKLKVAEHSKHRDQKLEEYILQSQNDPAGFSKETQNNLKQTNAIEIRLDRARYMSSIADYVYEFLTSTYCLDKIQEPEAKNIMIKSIIRFIQNLREDIDESVENFEEDQLKQFFLMKKPEGAFYTKLATETELTRSYWNILLLAMVALKHGTRNFEENDQLFLLYSAVESLEASKLLEELLEEELTQNSLPHSSEQPQ